MDLISELRSRHRQRWHADALVTASGERISYADLWGRVDGHRKALESAGVQPGCRAMLAVADDLEFLGILLACLSDGVSVAPVAATTSAVRNAAEMGLAHHLVTSLPPNRAMPGFGAALEPFDGVGRLAHSPIEECHALSAGDGPELWLMSSGSTSAPKVARLGMAGSIFVAESNAQALGVTPADRTLLLLPLAYSYGLIGQVLTHLLMASTIILPNRSGPSLLQLAALVERFGVTSLMLVPRMVRLWAAASVGAPPAMPGVRLATVGGGAIDGRHFQILQNALPRGQAAVTYGLVEAGPRVCTGFLDAELVEMGGVGVPIHGVDLDLGDRCDPWSAQAIRVRTPGMMLGYARCNPGRPSPIDGGWLDTGDLGELRDGVLFVSGRASRRVKAGGSMLQLEDVERWFYRREGTVSAVAHMEAESLVIDVQLTRRFHDLGVLGDQAADAFGMERHAVRVRRAARRMGGKG